MLFLEYSQGSSGVSASEVVYVLVAEAAVARVTKYVVLEVDIFECGIQMETWVDNGIVMICRCFKAHSL